MKDIKLSGHAKDQINLRQISQEDVFKAIKQADQIVDEGDEQKIYQKVIGKYLIRVFVSFAKEPPIIKTVYRTSKIDKYWQNENQI